MVALAFDCIYHLVSLPQIFIKREHVQEVPVHMSQNQQFHGCMKIILRLQGTLRDFEAVATCD